MSTLLRFYTYPQAKQDAIVRAFWTDYFTRYPDNGSIPELNDMRRRAKRGPIPDYEQWKRERLLGEL